MTTDPSKSVAPIHDRMTLIIKKNNINNWLSYIESARNYLSTGMPELALSDAQ